MNNLWKQFLYKYKYGGIHIRLITWNVAILMLTGIGYLIADGLSKELTFSKFVANWLYASSDPWWLLTKPWTIFTYMFQHADIMHLLFNMLTLYFAGSMFEHLLNGRRLTALYLLGGIMALLFHVLSVHVFPFNGFRGDILIVGASGSISAIFMALAVYAPQLEVALFGIFRMKLIILAALYILLELLRVQDQDGVARFAHLGGAFMGYLFILSLKKGKDLTKPVYMVLNLPKTVFKKRRKMRVVHHAPSGAGSSASARSQPLKDQTKPAGNSEYSTMSQKEKQKIIDNILDKISRSGYDSLTAKEKEILFKAGND